MKAMLYIHTLIYNRWTQKWEKIGTQTFSINAKTIISAKRKVTDIIHNDMKVDVGYEAHKDPLWWHRWFPSSIEPNAYKMSDPFNGRQMRADLKFY